MFLHFDEVWNQVCLNSSPRDGVGFMIHEATNLFEVT